MRLLELHLIVGLTEAAAHATAHATAHSTAHGTTHGTTHSTAHALFHSSRHLIVVEALTEGVGLETLLLLLLLLHATKWLRSSLTEAASGTHLILLRHHIITRHAAERVRLVIHREALHVADHGLERLLLLLLLLLLLWLRLSEPLHQAALTRHACLARGTHHAVEG